MTQEQRLNYLLEALLAERGQGGEAVPAKAGEKRRLLRALFNLRPPLEADATFLRVQDAYLTEEIRRRGITEAEDLPPLTDGLFLWRGDITTLRADAVVNAANSRLLGMLCAGARLHRQRDPHICRRPTAAGLRAADGAAGIRRTSRTGKNHPGVQPAFPFCAAHRGAGGIRLPNAP